MKKLIFILCVIVPSLSHADIFKNPTGIFGSVIGSTGTASPAAPVISGFSLRRIITIDHTKVDPSQASYVNFPVLISTSSVEFSTSASGGFLTGNGFDVVFASDTSCAQKYWLNWDTETVNASGSGTFISHVQVPLISSTTDTPIQVCLGSSTLTSYQGHSTATYDTNFKAIWHKPSDASVLSMKDSTVNADTLVSTNSPTAITGKIDGAVSLSATTGDHFCELSASTGNTNVAAFTVSAWIENPSFPLTYQAWAGKVLGDGSTTGFTFLVKSNAKLATYISGVNVNYDGTGTNTLSAGTTYFLTMSYSAATGLIGYVNGGVDGTAATGGAITTNNTSPFCVGLDHDSAAGTWTGMEDQVEFSDIARTAGWIATEYASQNSPLTFVTYSSSTVGP